MLVYVICYGAAMLFAFSAHFTLSGMSLMFAALYLYLWEYGKSGNPLHLRGLFSLFYVGGEGISCLKLSNLQKDWSLETWACFFVAFAAFWNVYALAEKKFGSMGKKALLVTEVYREGCREIRDKNFHCTYRADNPVPDCLSV